MRSGADVKSKNKEGHTPVTIAVARMKIKSIEVYQKKKLLSNKEGEFRKIMGKDTTGVVDKNIEKLLGLGMLRKDPLTLFQVLRALGVTHNQSACRSTVSSRCTMAYPIPPVRLLHQQAVMRESVADLERLLQEGADVKAVNQVPEGT